MTDRIVAIVPAAGQGTRAQAAGHEGLPKQYLPLCGQPMLRWSVQALLADVRVQAVRVAVAPGDDVVAGVLSGLPRTVWRPCGGDTRAATVRQALVDAQLDADDWVLVHDAARPGLSAEALARLIDACLAQQTGGLLALPVADTVKRMAGAGVSLAAGVPARVEATVSRQGLWLAQTPQMFRAGELLAALSAADADVTDESSAMERIGHQPLLVLGCSCNFKVTWPDDARWMALALADAHPEREPDRLMQGIRTP